jgi:hypothetical protein
MRPATHDDPNAIPRNGTEVPWVELPDLERGRSADRAAKDPGGTAAEERRRRT